jgi:hypothetical protein
MAKLYVANWRLHVVQTGVPVHLDAIARLWNGRRNMTYCNSLLHCGWMSLADGSNLFDFIGSIWYTSDGFRAFSERGKEWPPAYRPLRRLLGNLQNSSLLICKRELQTWSPSLESFKRAAFKYFIIKFHESLWYLTSVFTFYLFLLYLFLFCYTTRPLCKKAPFIMSSCF